jgi:type VI secretion system protein ImpE
MDSSQLFKAGQLSEAIDAQIAVVKTDPINPGKRLFLFELLAFAGELDRAQKQIEAIPHDDPEVGTALIDYRRLLDAERARRQVFLAKGQPEFLAPPPEHVKLRLLGLLKASQGATAEADEAFQQANSQMPVIQGSLNDKPVDGVRDGDDALGTVLEVFANGKYCWIPLEQIVLLTMTAPRFPRDLLWIPVQLEVRDSESGNAFLPTLYPNTHLESDPQLKLGRFTDWRGEPIVRGIGLKTFFVGPDESSILDWRKLEVK